MEKIKNIVIVESPNKISSISKYLGSNYKVLSSVGHIVYLPSSGPNRFGIDLNTWTPHYKINPTKKEIVNKLKAEVKDAKTVYIATDPDREGEAIASNLVDFLKIKDRYYRIRFNEITQKAVLRSMEHPDKIDENLVDSQIARRVLDRVIGFKLSELMRRKITNFPSSPSAGRVQSIALKLVVEREKAIKDFKPVEYYTIQAKINDQVFALWYNPKVNGDNKEWISPLEINKIFNTLTSELKVIDIKVTQRNDVRIMPLKQASLYKKGDSTLQMSSRAIQSAAQRLYEGYGDGGLISYPRTDSTRLSMEFVENAKLFIQHKYGQQYVATEIIGTAGAQDAHEAIRPTNLELTPQLAQQKFDLNNAEFKVYELIYFHTLQALMTVPRRQIARYELATVNQQPSQIQNFKVSFSKIIFDGYLKVFNYDDKKSFFDFKKDEIIKIQEFNKLQHFTKPPARYNDGSLIETLDNIGVGRPSTFATTVNILKDREYVKVENRALIATDFGQIVYEKLTLGFKKIMNENYTAQVEKHLDEIAEGKYNRKILLDSFWQNFNTDYSSATSDLDVTALHPVLANKKCPQCGGELIVRRNKSTNEKFFACQNFPKCRYTESDPLQKKNTFFRRKKIAKKSVKKTT